MFFKKLSKVSPIPSSLDTDSLNEEKTTTDAVLTEKPTLEIIQKIFTDCADLQIRQYQQKQIDILYFSVLVDGQKVEEQILNPIQSKKAEEISQWIEDKNLSAVSETKQLTDFMLAGNVAIFHQDKVYTYDVYAPEKRGIEKSETETVILGAHDAFTEDIHSNLSIIRSRVKSPRLKVLKLKAGEVSKKTVYIIYIDGLVSQENVDEMKKRINLIETDSVYDANMLAQLIDERPDSIFPQYYNTELPDVAASKLVSGKLIALLEGSPTVISAPTTFFEFLQSPDDYNQRWWIGTSLRIIRLIAIFITLSFTAVYVAVVTYHYEMLPEDILITIAESRAKVPFEPIVEALIMELTIELLREAGARLPTKIGQTIGIVGGIVIGTAAVEAGLTSNVLIIAVASSAIASFTLPSYNMANSIRIIRFSLIVLAGMFGVFGFIAGFGIMVIHLASLTSLNTPYLIPVSPFYFKDWLDTFIRGPYWIVKDRPVQTNTSNEVRNKMRK